MPIPLILYPNTSIYQWLTFAQAKDQLAQRLADTAGRFWTDTERGLYIIEALRVYNCFTSQWSVEYTFAAPLVTDQIWYNLATLSGSPRLRTVTDS